MRVNYIKEITSFTKFIRDEEPSGYAQLLWYALMAIFNERGSGDEWPDEIRISTRKLLADFPFSEDTLAKAREELVSLGRIRYQAGSRGERPAYGMVWFSEESSCESRRPTSFVSPDGLPPSKEGKAYEGLPVDKMDFSTAPQDSPAVNPQDNPPVNPLTAGYVAGHYPNENAYAYTRPSSSSPALRFKVIGGDEDDEDTGEIMLAWRETVGPERLPVAAARDLARDARERGMPGAAADALREAARQGAKSPVMYAHAVLADWQTNGKRSRPREGRGEYLRRNYSPGDFAAMTVDLDAEAERWSS